MPFSVVACRRHCRGPVRYFRGKPHNAYYNTAKDRRCHSAQYSLAWLAVQRDISQTRYDGSDNHGSSRSSVAVARFSGVSCRHPLRNRSVASSASPLSSPSSSRSLRSGQVGSLCVVKCKKVPAGEENMSVTNSVERWQEVGTFWVEEFGFVLGFF